MNMDVNLENILGLCLIILCFFGGGLGAVIHGLKSLGVMKKKQVNELKWTKINARIVDVNSGEMKTSGKNGITSEYFIESVIEYEFEGKTYRKYLRELHRYVDVNTETVEIYCKNSNPNYIKLAAEAESPVHINKFAGAFSCFIGAVLLLSGCLIFSSFFE